MVRELKFRQGTEVEVSIDRGGGLYGSWFTATIDKHISSDKFLVEYDDLDVERTVVQIHQLRPVPWMESDWTELKTGDKVEAFWKERWWEGHVTEVIGNGRLFSVRFTDSKEMMFPRDLVRVHRRWINNNWVPPITEPSRTYRKELRRELKKQKRENRRNKINELPDCILLHIMSFLEAQDAVRTCILSKRWKDLCKHVTTLTYFRSPTQTLKSFKYAKSFKRFKSWVMSSRDQSCPLISLTVYTHIEQDEEDLYTLIQYTLSNNLQHLKIKINPNSAPKPELLPLILTSHTLTSLRLSYARDRKYWYPKSPILPKFFHMPALRTLHLEYVYFVATHNHCADPFSNCHVLNTLVLDRCFLVEDAQVLCISNQTLSNLTISSVSTHQFSLFTPNLRFFDIMDMRIFHKHLSSTCNFSFLQEVNMDGALYHGKTSIFLRWLQVLANVKILKLDICIIETILTDWRLNPISKKAQPPCFFRLESLIVNKSLNSGLPDEDITKEDITKVVEHLLQNTTPMPRVLIS